MKKYLIMGKTAMVQDERYLTGKFKSNSPVVIAQRQGYNKPGLRSINIESS